jgi:hypothetical protein
LPTPPAYLLGSMGAAGKKLHGHGARSKASSPAASVSDGGYGAPPHPARVRAGQRFWPRSGRRRAALLVYAVGGDGIIRARRLDGEGRCVRITSQRLTAKRPDGQGRHYQFLAWAPRRYRTWAVVISVESHGAVLVLPEWHPARPVRLPTRLIPPDARQAQAWLSLQADLSVPTAGQLNPAGLRPCTDPGPTRCARPTLGFES